MLSTEKPGPMPLHGPWPFAVLTMGLRQFFSVKFYIRLLLAVLILLGISTVNKFWYYLRSWSRYGLQQSSLWGCGMRKAPYIQQVDTLSYTVTWEMTCLSEDIVFGWTAVPLEVGEGDIVRRKRQTAGNGRRMEMEGGGENTIGFQEMEYFRMGARHHLYRVRLDRLAAEQLVEYYLLQADRLLFLDAFPTLPDHTGPAPAAPPALSPILVAIVGDNQSGKDTFSRICKRIESRRPHLLVHLGDAVQRWRALDNWQKHLFDPTGQTTTLLAHCPFIVSLGNHDAYKGTTSSYISPYGEGHLNDSSTARSYYHAMSVGPIRFIILDANQETDDQAAWLEKELSKPSTQKAPFKVVLCHISPFIEFWSRKAWAAGESKWPHYVRSRLQPLFEKYRVDLVLSGHQHNYQRGMWKGVNYVTSGGAGGELDSERVEDHHVYRVTAIEHHYMMMKVTGSGLEFQVYSPSDALLDSFYIPRGLARKMKPSEMLPQ